MNNKNILITGGTGSFGKEFIFQIYRKYKPKKVIVYSRDEFKQFELSKIFNKSQYKGLRFFIGDIRDEKRLNSALKNIDYVIHAAAMKQVPISEYNPQECIKTNILGAQNLIDCCIANKVKKVIALSTDKAANPVNLYGATKLVSDKLFISSNILSAHVPTIFSVVRYGNVLNSRGSVVPYFKNLAKLKNKAIPITDRRMTRFFITLESSVQFVISCFKEMKGGEIFIPKLPSIKIIDIAKSLAPNSKIKIIGVRPGEKINEILVPKDDSNFTYESKNYYIIAPSIQLPSKNIQINKIKKLKKVPINFEYGSESNPNFLTKKKLIKILRDDSI
tara:strand:+ start:5440 stop:6438 length:999 start_codon:yes stop_codon:yes gene_type:complete